MIGERKISKWALGILAALAILSTQLLGKSIQMNSWYNEKIEAAHIMEAAIDLIRTEAFARGLEVDARFDPNRTGLIGPQESIITTDRGILDAKLMVTNPNFAAVMVDLLRRAGVHRGDNVAVSYTGSMPAANLALLSACEALGARPIITSSVGASNWGATDPRFAWLDMERFLVEKGIFRYRSLAASMGGSADTARGLSKDGRAAIEDIIRRNEVMLIEEQFIEQSITKRLEIYDREAGIKPVKCFINIGGSLVSLGNVSNGALLVHGLNLSIDVTKFFQRGLIVHMADRSIPVIHILKVRELVRDYDLSRFPVPLPKIGEGKVYVEESYNLRSALIATLLLLVAIVFVVELDLFLIPEIISRFKRRQLLKGEHA